jgi:predicted glycosyltransferase
MWEVHVTRILVYSHDTFGLGNIRRMVRISEALAERDPNVSVLIVTGSPMLHAFRLPPRIDYVKLPCLARDTSGTYGVRHLEMNFGDAVRMRASLILSAAADFDPDIVLIDKKPLGVAGEVGPMLKLFAGREKRPEIHLLLRDILDTPAATRKVWEANDYHGAISRFYDSVLVVGDDAVFDMAEAYRFPSATRNKLSYCGYINRANPELLARPYSKAERPLLLVHAGGGEDGAGVMDATLAALELMGDNRGFDCRIIGGPELNDVTRKAFARRAAALIDVQWTDFSDSMGMEIANADLIVSMGGYNSICEILSYRKRAIIVPRSVPVREQRIRAEAMDALGLLRMIPAEDIDPSQLARMIRTEIERGNVVPSLTARIRFDGLNVICDRLLGAQVASLIRVKAARP